jgi:copper transport protein
VVATGLAQAVIQIGRPTALWTTAYGRVFLAKFALLACLFALAAFNRWRLTARAAAGDPRAARSLARCIKTEMAIALAIPLRRRCLALHAAATRAGGGGSAPASAHVQTAQAMADVTITPGGREPSTPRLSSWRATTPPRRQGR